MAYADRDGFHRPKPVSFGATMAINGVLLLAIINAVPAITKDLPTPPTIVIDVPPEDPPIVKQPEAQRQKPDEKQAFVPQKEDDKPDTGPAGGYVLTNDEEIKTGESEKIKPDPVVETVRLPVIVNAKIDPRYAKNLQPEYPMGEIRNQMEGKVVIRVLVGPDGRVKRVEAVSSPSPGLLEATTRQALSKWRFIPATRDGAPIESWREMTVRFQIPD